MALSKDELPITYWVSCKVGETCEGIVRAMYLTLLTHLAKATERLDLALLGGINSDKVRISDLAFLHFQNHTLSEMPTDNAAVFELVQAIGHLVHNLPYNGSSLTDAKRAELVRNAERLAIAAREPAENLYFQTTQV